MATAAIEVEPAPPREIFISYSRKDEAFVMRLAEALQRRGRAAWIDSRRIRPTEEFMQAIYRAIEGADTFVFVLSPDSISSKVARLEVAHAVKHNKRMVPVVARMVEAEAVPEPLAKLNWIFFCREKDDFEEATDTLVAACDTDLDWLQSHTRLVTRAVEWEGKGRNNSFALRGVDLKAAEQWLAQAGSDRERQPTALQTEYIIASRRAASRTQRITLGAVTFGAAVALVLAILFWLQRGEADRQRTTAVEERGRAITERDRSQRIASGADFREATRSIAQGNLTRALAHLARALELWPANHAAADRLFTLLTQRRFYLPLTDPVPVTGRVTCVRFNADGNCLVVAVHEQSATLWDIGVKGTSSRTVRSLHKIHDAQLSYDGKLLATACGSVRPDGAYETEFRPAGFAQVWDASNGQLISGPLEHSASVQTVRFDAQGHQVITASEDGTAKTWDAHSGKMIKSMELSAPGLYASFSPDGQQAFSIAADARLWSLEEGSHLPLAIPTKTGQPLRGEFSPDGKFVVVVFQAGDSEDSFQRVAVFDSTTGKPMAEDSGSSAPDMPSIAFDGRGKTVALSVAGVHRNKDSTGGVEIIDTETGKMTTSFEYARPLNYACYGADDTTVLYAGDDGELHIRSRSEFSKDSPEFAEPVRFGLPILRFEPQRGGHQLAVAFRDPSNQQGYVQLLDTRTSVQHHEVVPAPDLGGRKAASDLQVADGAILDKSTDGTLSILGFEDGTARLARNGTNDPAGIRHDTLPDGRVITAKFGPDANIFATGGGGDFRVQIGYARVWKTRGNAPITELLPHDRAVVDVDFTTDGKRLVTLSSLLPKSTGAVTRWWDVETGQPLSDAQRDGRDGDPAGARFGDEGRRVFTVVSDDGDKPVARAWDAGFGRSAPVPDWLPRLAKLVSGYQLPEEGEVLQPLVGRAKELRDLSATLLRSASNDAYTRLGKWFFDRSIERKLSPYSTLSIAARIEECLTEGGDLALSEAEQLANGDSKIIERISTRRLEAK